MKVQVMSDLHLEFGGSSIIGKIASVDSDVIVLAGDTHVGNEKLMNSVNSIFDAAKKPIVLIAGNHEYYGYTKSVEDEKFKTLFDNPDIHLLNNDTCIIDDIMFIGSTGWWTEPEDLIKNGSIFRRLNDFNLIKDIFDNDFGITWGKECKSFFEQSLKNNKGKKMVCISHHGPTSLSIPSKYQTELMNVFYSNNWNDMILDYQPNLWVHGHTHDSLTYTLGKTNVICNPRGYSGYDVNMEFKYDLIEEI